MYPIVMDVIAYLNLPEKSSAYLKNEMGTCVQNKGHENTIIHELKMANWGHSLRCIFDTSGFG